MSAIRTAFVSRSRDTGRIHDVDVTSMYGQIWQSSELMDDIDAICSHGGRFAGSESELRSREWVRNRLRVATGQVVQSHAFRFRGWERGMSRVTLLSSTDHVELASTSLVLSPATPPGGIETDVVDLGHGNVEDFAAVGTRLHGRAALVRHSFPFSTHHVHRRMKYRWARDAGASAFLIANCRPAGGVVTGSSGRGEDIDIPAAGITYEAGERIARSAGGETLPRIRLEIDSGQREWLAENLYVELPGQTDEWVILCAHLDGHDLAESAMDNGSGVAAVLEVARRLGPYVADMRRGLRIMFFTVEEWGLWGSEVYLNSLSEEQRRAIRLVINLDTVVGHPQLFALTSERQDVERFVREAVGAGGVPVAPIRPVLGNSDHYNFFRAGIPSLRLIAGYDDPSALSSLILTPGDTRDKIDPGQLRMATITALSLTASACQSGELPEHFEPSPDLSRTDGWGTPPAPVEPSAVSGDVTGT